MLVVWSLALLSMGASPLESARRALDGVRCPEALAALDQVDALEGLSPADNAERLTIRGICLVLLKKPDAAEKVFRELVWVSPQSRIGDEYGPRVRTPFLEARAWVEEHAGLGPREVRLDGDTLVLPADPLGLIARVEVRFTVAAEEQHVELAPRPATQDVPWRGSVPSAITVRLLGVHARVISEAALEPRPTPPVVLEAPPPPPPRRRFVAPAVALFVGAGGSLAAALVFEVRSYDSNRALASAERDGVGRITNLSQRDAFALEARVRADLTVKTVLYGAAAAFAIAGVVLVIAGAPVTVAPTPEGVSVSGALSALFEVAR